MVSEKRIKLPTQPKRFTGKKPSEEPTPVIINETVEASPQQTIEEQNTTRTKFLYKILASNGDYNKLQDQVTDHLNDGWTTVGGIALAIHADPYSKMTIFSQAIQKSI
jgi:hypothetical protein